MSHEKWIKLKENIGKDIEMLGFLSISKKKDIVLRFMNRDKDKKALITIIILLYTNQEE